MMRQAKGLRWADVDLDQGALHVTRRLKRRTSRRQVLLVALAVRALNLHQEHQEGGAPAGWVDLA